ncbi:MAG TPA: hypothetical protein VGM92_01215 [Candidatus Kapabacteria bacterium]|jgi:hypothetical protein
MALTTGQILSFEAAGEGIQEGKPVILTGKSNGKTTVLHTALEVLGQRDERTGGISTSPKHPEDKVIDFFRVYFPPMPSLPNTMRQVLAFAKVRPKHCSADVVMQYDDFMRGMAKANRAVCLAVDNAELIPGRAYTVLKALNEYRDPLSRKTIGAGILIAGDITKLKNIPPSFLIRAKEVLIGKISEKEIVELIESLHPGQSQWFDRKAISQINLLRTTLQMKSVIDQTLYERRRYRLTNISEEAVAEKVLALPNEKDEHYRMALAA